MVWGDVWFWMSVWLDKLQYDAVSVLLDSGNPAVRFFVGRDFLGESGDLRKVMLSVPEVKKLLGNQREDGSWRFSGKKRDVFPLYHYALVETWKSMRVLVNQYELNREVEGVERGAEFLFGCQSEVGDIRGMIGNQYAPYYTGAMLGMLIRAGYGDDVRVRKGLEWLLLMRQDDGGWTIPILTHSFDRKEQYLLTSTDAMPVEPVRSKPFSHNWTDMVLRGFAWHEQYCERPDIQHAASLLKSRLFERDVYGSYKSKNNWTRFVFWWTNLLTSLEVLQRLGFSVDDPQIRKGVEWFVDNQLESGLWALSYPDAGTLSNKVVYRRRQEWLTLRILRVLKNFS